MLSRASSFGYALEVQTKTHFSYVPIDAGVLAHEIAHQWFGDSVGPATWREIWFNEGWAQWWEWYWNNKENRNPTTVEQQFTANYNSGRFVWNMPPANVPGAAQLFDGYAVYLRPAMMLETYRQIVGHANFFAFQRELLTEYAYSSISTEAFIALAKRFAQERAGFPVSYLSRLDEFFRQWLYGTAKPAFTPATFFQELEPLLAIRSINATDLEITWRKNNAPFFLEQSEDLNGALWTRVDSAPIFINGQARITLERPRGNRLYRLRKE